MISNTNERRKDKKRQNDQRCDMLARVKLEDEGISRHGRNTRLNRNKTKKNKSRQMTARYKKTLERPQLQHRYDIVQW